MLKSTLAEFCPSTAQANGTAWYVFLFDVNDCLHTSSGCPGLSGRDASFHPRLPQLPACLMEGRFVDSRLTSLSSIESTVHSSLPGTWGSLGYAPTPHPREQFSCSLRSALRANELVPSHVFVICNCLVFE